MSGAVAACEAQPSRATWKDAATLKITSPCWIATTRRAENERPSRSRWTRNTVGRERVTAAQEVAVQRVRPPPGVDRAARGQQCLGRNLPAVEVELLAVDGRGPEQVALHRLEGEQVAQVHVRHGVGGIIRHLGRCALVHHRLIVSGGRRIPGRARS